MKKSQRGKSVNRNEYAVRFRRVDTYAVMEDSNMDIVRNVKTFIVTKVEFG